MNTQKPIIAVFGATGQQGGGVVSALQRQGQFRIRAITRNASKAEGLADEVVEADLNRADTLADALRGVHGVFAVTNFWEPGGTDELAQGRALVDAAKAAGVKHFIWSTLPNVEVISGGRFDVVHFTEKAKVDAVISEAGFDFHTFVEAPFYFQNLTGMMGPQPQPDGSKAWVVPMDPAAKVIHMGDIRQLGTLVAGALANPAQVGQGQRLALAGDRVSWNEVVETLNGQGHHVAVNRVPAELYDGFYPGAREMREMMEYFEAHTYFGPEADSKLTSARQVATEPATTFAQWAHANMPIESLATTV
jgi:uncharacterized protein YbjT (DUF2867 family)